MRVRTHHWAGAHTYRPRRTRRGPGTRSQGKPFSLCAPEFILKNVACVGSLAYLKISDDCFDFFAQWLAVLEHRAEDQADVYGQKAKQHANHTHTHGRAERMLQ